MRLVLVMVIFLAVVLAVYAIVSPLSDRLTSRALFRQLVPYGGQGEGREEFLDPVLARAFAPLAAQAARAGHAVSPAGYVQRQERKLILAGRGGAGTLDRFLALRLVASCCSPSGCSALRCSPSTGRWRWPCSSSAPSVWWPVPTRS